MHQYATDGSTVLDDPWRWSTRRRVMTGFGCIVAAVLVVVGVFALIDRDHRHERWRGVVCRDAETASADRLLTDAAHLPWNAETRTDAVAYAEDLRRFGSASLVTQRAFDTLARACAS